MIYTEVMAHTQGLIAEGLNLSQKTLRRRIDEGQLPVIRDGRILRVHPRDLERYISARRSR